MVKITDSDGEVSWVTKDKAVRKPFLDDDGNEIISAKKEDAEKEEDLVAEKPKRGRKKASPKAKESSAD